MFVQLTPEREFTVKLVAQLLSRHSHVLADFERSLADEVVDRFVSAEPEIMPVTDLEWPVLEAVAQAMADDLAKSGRIAA